jgi:hypothetical protein
MRIKGRSYASPHNIKIPAFIDEQSKICAVRYVDHVVTVPIRLIGANGFAPDAMIEFGIAHPVANLPEGEIPSTLAFYGERHFCSFRPLHWRASCRTQDFTIALSWPAPAYASVFNAVTKRLGAGLLIPV